MMPLSAFMHDAASGFHDIKPLPRFQRLGPSEIVFFLLLLLATFAILWFLQKRLRKPNTIPTPPPPPPITVALKALRILKQQQKECAISLRDFALTLSALLRSYLESSLSFRASEQTASEIKRTFPEALKATLPNLSSPKQSKLISQVDSLLRLCERVCFADDSETQFSLEDEDLSLALHQAEEIIRKLNTLLQKEEEQGESIIAQSRLSQKDASKTKKGENHAT